MSSLEFVGAGTLINVLAILAGASLGIAAGSKLSTKSQSLITDILGLITLLGAATALRPLWSSDFNSALPDSSSLLVILAAMLIGGLIGSLLSLESRLDSFGENLRKGFKASAESPFVEGFVSASLLFVIGPLAILGSVSDGMSQGFRSTHPEVSARFLCRYGLCINLRLGSSRLSDSGGHLSTLLDLYWPLSWPDPYTDSDRCDDHNRRVDARWHSAALARYQKDFRCKSLASTGHSTTNSGATRLIPSRRTKRF